MSEEQAEVQEREVPGAREGEHVPPTFKSPAFHCPHCGVLAKQGWTVLSRARGGYNYQSKFWLSICTNTACNAETCWVEDGVAEDGELDGRIVEPLFGGGPRPHPDMPEDVREDYEEARRIVNQSPRGAAALLRLAVQKLMVDLEQPGKKINDDIAALVQAGLPVEAQQALDVLRVVGNNAVHPGEIDLRDDVQTATGLFEILNFIVQDRIAQPKKISAMFNKLPQKARDAITKRDSTGT